MAGNQCADFSAVPVTVTTSANQAPVAIPGLCRMGPGENGGVLTYADGRVATIVDKLPSQPDGVYVAPPPGDADRTPIQVSPAVVARMRTLQGVEFGSCTAVGMGSNISSLGFLQTTYNGSPISWGPDHLREVYRLLGQGEGQSANAFICSDNRNIGRLAINNDGAHRASLLAAISTLEGSAGSLDSAHREALLQSLRAAAGVPAPQSSFMEFLKYAGGLLGVGLVFGLVVPWITRWLGPRDGGHGGGNGGGGRPVANNPQGTPPTPTVTTVTNPPTSARVRAVNPLAAGIMAMNGGGQPGSVPGVVVPTVNGVTPGVGVLPAPVVVVPPVGVPAVPPVVVEVPVMVPAL